MTNRVLLLPCVPYCHVDCAVCDDGYAPGVMNRCHECSEKNRRWSAGLAAAAAVVVLIVTIIVVSNVLRDSEDEPTSACPRMVRSSLKWLVKGLPLSAIKIVVVVLQIITQVGVIDVCSYRVRVKYSGCGAFRTKELLNVVGTHFFRV